MEDPIFLLHPGAEYHLNIILLHPPSGHRLPVKSAAWIRIAPLNARAVTLPVTRVWASGAYCSYLEIR